MAHGLRIEKVILDEAVHLPDESFPTDRFENGSTEPNSGGGGNRTREPIPTETWPEQAFPPGVVPSGADFSWWEEVGTDLIASVERGERGYFQLAQTDGIYVWRWPIDLAVPILERMLAAARIAANLQILDHEEADQLG